MTDVCSKLEQARREVADANGILAALNVEQHAAEAGVAAAQKVVAASFTKTAAQRAKLIKLERALGAAEQTALDQHCLALAANIIKRQSSDPLRYRDSVTADLHLLQRAVRGPMDTPINQVYTVEPLIQQAISLLPVRDSLDVPVSELSHRGLPWETRRRLLLAIFETDEPQRAA